MSGPVKPCGCGAKQAAARATIDSGSAQGSAAVLEKMVWESFGLTPPGAAITQPTSTPGVVVAGAGAIVPTAPVAPPAVDPVVDPVVEPTVEPTVDPTVDPVTP